MKISNKTILHLKNNSLKDVLNFDEKDELCQKTGRFIKTNVLLKYETISNQALEMNQNFDACLQCGQIYYIGFHHQRWGYFIDTLQKYFL